LPEGAPPTPKKIRTGGKTRDPVERGFFQENSKRNDGWREGRGRPQADLLGTGKTRMDTRGGDGKNWGCKFSGLAIFARPCSTGREGEGGTAVNDQKNSNGDQGTRGVAVLAYKSRFIGKPLPKEVRVKLSRVREGRKTKETKKTKNRIE